MVREEYSRRGFIKSGTAAFAGVALTQHLQVRSRSRVAETSQRRVYEFNHKWLYHETVPPNGTSPQFDDSRFVQVTIPHTNRVLPWQGFDDKEYQFVSLYRRHFKLPDELRGRRVFIDFGGIMTAAILTLNGHRLGEHRGGYTPFTFELTPHLRWTADNVLAVEVDSTERADIPPFGGKMDYLTFGGIYRDVALCILPDTFIENVFVRTMNPMGSDRS